MLTAFDILLLFLAILISGIGLSQRWSIWKKGAPEKRPKNLGALLSYILSHKMILRKRGVGIAHLLLFWGFVFNLIIVVVSQFDVTMPISVARGITLFLDLLGIAMLAAVLFFLVRRIRRPRGGTPWETISPLIVFLFIILTGFCAAGARLALVCGDAPWFSLAGTALSFISPASPLYMLTMIKIHLFATLLFLAIFPYTLLRHLIATPLNIYYRNPKPLQELKLVPLEQGKPGISTIKELSWKGLLDIESCTLCGRCEESCPASQALKPLSPRKIVRTMYQQIDQYYRKNRQPASSSPPTLEQGITGDEIWSCTTCGACNYECPAYLEIVEKIIDLRRHQVEQGNCPSLSTAALEGIANRGNPWALPPTERTTWAWNMHFRSVTSDDSSDIIYWVGCAGSYDSLGHEVSRAMLALFKRAGINYALLGTEERCCGDPARRLGDEGLFQKISRQNIATFNGYGIRKIVTSCPHCFHVFKNEYPPLGGTFDVYHHVHFLSELVKSNTLRIAVPRESPSVFYQDPCYLGRYNGSFDDSRWLIRGAINAQLLNPSGGDVAFCCGGGGGQMWLDVRKGERIENVRIAQIETAKPDTIATACPYCRIMFDSALSSRAARGKKWSPRIKDIAELLAENL